VLIAKIGLISLITLLSAFPNNASIRQQALLSNLNKESGYTLEISWNDNTGTPGFIAGQLTKPSKHSAQWIALEYMNKVKSLYTLKRVDENMKVTRIDNSDPDSIKVYLQRYLYKQEVCGDQITVTLNGSGVIQRIEGEIHADLEQQRLNRPAYPAVSPQEAIQIANSRYNVRTPALEAQVRSCYLPTRAGIPLIHVVTLGSSSNPTVVQVHSLTGRILE
jgi:Zn-dependent metalloprotease